MKPFLMPLLVGAGAGALVGLGIWLFAERRMEASFEAGSSRLAREVGVGAGQLAQQLTTGRQQLRTELARQVESQVAPAVRAEVEATLRRYGITPTTGQRLSAVLARADQIGLI